MHAFSRAWPMFLYFSLSPSCSSLKTSKGIQRVFYQEESFWRCDNVVWMDVNNVFTTLKWYGVLTGIFDKEVSVSTAYKSDVIYFLCSFPHIHIHIKFPAAQKVNILSGDQARGVNHLKYPYLIFLISWLQTWFLIFSWFFFLISWSKFCWFLIFRHCWCTWFLRVISRVDQVIKHNITTREYSFLY